MIWNVTFTAGVIAVLYGVVRGLSTLYGFDETSIVAIVVGAVVAVVAFAKRKK